jgi:hypothetical protein
MGNPSKTSRTRLGRMNTQSGLRPFDNQREN